MKRYKPKNPIQKPKEPVKNANPSKTQTKLPIFLLFQLLILLVYLQFF